VSSRKYLAGISKPQVPNLKEIDPFTRFSTRLFNFNWRNLFPSLKLTDEIIEFSDHIISSS